MQGGVGRTPASCSPAPSGGGRGERMPRSICGSGAGLTFYQDAESILLDTERQLRHGAGALILGRLAEAGHFEGDHPEARGQQVVGAAEPRAVGATRPR